MNAKSLIILVASPLYAGAVWAQELVYSEAATLACLVEAEGSARQSCIGASANACMATPSGGSTVGMGFCLNQELGYWDERLNTSYAALRRAERALAVEMAAQELRVPDSLVALRDMQRSWIGFRDAACSYEFATWGGGTGGGPALLACLMHLTAEQALMLEDELKERFQ